MKNKNPVPIIKDGPNKSIVFHHADLDGYNGAQICQRWLQEKVDPRHEVKLVMCGYESVNKYAEDTFKEADQWRYILIVDISINQELSLASPENVYIFDHHDTSKYLLDMSPRFYWDEKYCGAVVAWKALFGSSKKDKALMKLMKVCNDFDMWQGDNEQPPKISFDMNALFWKDTNKWFNEFYNGFDKFTDDQQEIIDEHWRMQEELFENIIGKFTFEPKDPNHPHVLLLTGDDNRFDSNWWCNKLIREEGINIVIQWRVEKSRLSVRTSKDRMDWLHAGEWLQDNIQNIHNSKGGHKHAAGCSVDGMTVEEVEGICRKLEVLCNDHFSKKVNIA